MTGTASSLAMKRVYFLLSVLALWIMAFVMVWQGETNLPPLKIAVRYTILALYANLGFAYVWWSSDTHIKKERLTIWIWLALAGVLLSFLPPVFSGDMMYYLMRGRILGIYGKTPYAHTPSEFPNDMWRPYDIWPNQTDAYGPLSVYMQTAPVVVFGNAIVWTVWAYKIILLGLVALSVVYFWKLAEEFVPEGGMRLWVLYAYSPFVIVNAFIDGHNDIGLMALSVPSVYYLLKRKYGRAFLFWTLAFSVKYMVLLILPFYLITMMKQEKMSLMSLAASVWKYAFLAAGILFLLFWPIWGGIQTFVPILKTTAWFYTSSIPYAFQQGLKLAGIDMHWRAVQYLFLSGYAALYAWLIWHCFRKGSNPRELFRCLALAYAGFYISLISPLAAWYWLWAFPWIVLAQWPRTTLLVVLYSFTSLLAFFKRINYLSVIAASTYISVLFYDRFKKPAVQRI